eukprot:362074-Chlamydomonas_euryale.AAC.1
MALIPPGIKRGCMASNPSWTHTRVHGLRMPGTLLLPRHQSLETSIEDAAPTSCMCRLGRITHINDEGGNSRNAAANARVQARCKSAPMLARSHAGMQSCPHAVMLACSDAGKHACTQLNT